MTFVTNPNRVLGVRLVIHKFDVEERRSLAVYVHLCRCSPLVQMNDNFIAWDLPKIHALGLGLTWVFGFFL